MLLLLSLIMSHHHHFHFNQDGTGFTILKLKPNKTVNIPLNDKAAVIINADPSSISFSIRPKSGQIITIPSYPSDNLYITGEYFNISSNGEDEYTYVPIWVIPTNYCNANTGIMKAEHHLELKSKAINFTGNLCLFSQPQFRRAKVSVRVKMDDTKGKIDIFTGLDTEEPVRKCESGDCCKYTSHHHPFFIRITGKEGQMRLFTDYEVHGSPDGTVYCSIRPIPFLFKDKFKHRVGFLGAVHHQCESEATDMLAAFRVIGISLLLIVMLIMVLQYTGMINFGEICCPDREDQRFNNLKKDPYASPLDEPIIKNAVDISTQVNDEESILKP